MKEKRSLGIRWLGLLLLPLAACMAAPSASDGATVRWTGTVEAVLPDGLQVSGQRVRWTGQTQILGEIRVGSPVEIEGILVDGTVNALAIRAQPAEGSAAAMGGTIVQAAEALPPEVEFRGVVEEILADGYRIAGRIVIITTTTRMDGPIVVGTLVEVKGLLQPDGTILALRIHREEEGQPAIEFTGIVEAILPNGYRVSGQTVIVTTTTRVEGSITVGTLVEVKGVLQADGSVLARRIHVEEEEREIEFKGHVEEILPNGYRIGGRTVVVTSTTRIDGPITVGALVEVKGVLQADGSIQAVRIHLEDQSGDNSGSIQKGEDNKREDGGDKKGENREGSEDRHDEDKHKDEDDED